MEPSPDAHDATARARAGIERLQAGDAAGAAALLEQAIALGGPRRNWCLRLAQARSVAEDWEAMAEAYEALATGFPEEVDPRWWAQAGRARRMVGQWRLSADAYARAAALTPDNAEWHRLHGWALVQLDDGAGAVAVFEQALAALAPGEDPPWWAEVAMARRLAGDEAGAVDAYVRAIRSGAPVHPSSYRALGATLRSLVRQGAPGAGERLAAVRQAIGADAALVRFLDEHGGPEPADVTTELICQGESSVLVLRHEGGRGADVLRVVQKVTNRPGEADRLRYLGAHMGASPAGLTVPRPLAVYGEADLDHCFLEYVSVPSSPDQPLADLVRSEDRLADLACLVARVAAVVPTPDVDGPFLAADHSADRLQAAVDQFARSDLADALGDDPSFHQDLAAVAAAADAIVAYGEGVPVVLAHNDLRGDNLLAVEAEGRLTELVLLDWGEAGVNLAGADLHPLLYFGDRLGGETAPPEATRQRLFSAYAGELQALGVAATVEQCEFGASVVAFVRGAVTASEGGRRPWMLRNAVAAGRRAAALACA